MSVERNANTQGPLLIMLHWLGGSAQTWAGVAAGLRGRGVRCAPLDLPGFGAAADVSAYSVAAMADQVEAQIRKLRSGSSAAGEPWFLAGHSMGGKVAAVLGRRAADGAEGLENLRGLVLVSPSPPSPEPMGEDKRADALKTMGESTGNGREDRKRAEAWVDNNTGKLPLPDALRETAVNGVLGMNRTAFRHWMEHGSKEDWTAFVGTVPLPALIFAGMEETALGAVTQRRCTAPHFATAEVVELDRAAHLGPLERPGELVEQITPFLVSCGASLPTPQALPEPSFWALMQSERTSPTTRGVMEKRLGGSSTWDYVPRYLALAEFRTLRALVGRVVPDAGFDIAACLDTALLKMQGDGWRYAVLPSDNLAWHKGLRSLDLAADRAHGVRFVSLYPEQQDALLEEAKAGKLGKGLLGTLRVGESAEAFEAEQMQRWFEDVRAECTRHYIGDPRTMDRIGYTGFADDLGFTQIRLGEKQEFER